MARRCARRRRAGKPLQIAVDSAPGTTEATSAPLLAATITTATPGIRPATVARIMIVGTKT
jgi:hypothetical protein